MLFGSLIIVLSAANRNRRRAILERLLIQSNREKRENGGSQITVSNVRGLNLRLNRSPSSVLLADGSMSTLTFPTLEEPQQTFSVDPRLICCSHRSTSGE